MSKMSKAATLIGALVVEGIEFYGGEYESRATGASGSALRPVDRPLRNDGFHRYWMLSGERYRLRHDGTGWHVTNELFGRHVYRFVDRLPVVGGQLVLDQSAVYEIREQEPMGSWGVYQL
jgi:hypothetical protein